jgi:uncharacterized SAM-binding protein YcdF (DUF218 family)
MSPRGEGSSAGRRLLSRPAAIRGAVLGAAIGLIARDLDLQAIAPEGSRRPSLVLLAAAAGLVIGATRFRWVVTTAALALGALWTLVAFTPLSHWLGRDLVRSDRPAPADAVVVCASRLQPNGDPTVVALSRLVTGVRLLCEGYAPRLIVPDAPTRPRGYREAAASLALGCGSDREFVTVEPAHSTREEALVVQRLCRGRGWQHVIVVTSPFHSRRAAAAFEATGLRVTSCPALETRFDAGRLLRSDEALRAFGGIVHERLGLWIYRHRGWIAPELH